MDLGTIIGAIAGVILLMVAMLLTNVPFSFFISPTSFIVVIGGSLAAMMIANPATRMLRMIRYFALVFRAREWHEERIVSDMVTFAGRARREGLLALEDHIPEISDDFMSRGIQLVVDGVDPAVIQRVLLKDLEKIEERHQEVIKFFDDWGKLAPAFGLIGTLIGLVSLLRNLADRAGLGQALALALLTTLYGAAFANLFLLPISSKLEDRSLKEALVKEIIIEGVLSIQAGDNPRILLDKLIAYLPPGRRESVYSELEVRQYE